MDENNAQVFDGGDNPAFRAMPTMVLDHQPSEMPQAAQP